MQPENRFVAFIKNIWPRIYRIINQTLYFTVNFVKKIVTLSIEQIRGKNFQ